MLPDLRKFEVSSSQIESVVKAFGLGKVLGYSVEKGIKHDHSNKIVFIRSDNGSEYALKFYLNKERAIRFYIQFFVVTKLLNRNFRTCRMYATKHGKPFFKSKDYFVAVYDKINAVPISNITLDRLNKKKLLELFLRLRKELVKIENKTSFMKYIGSDFYHKYDFSIFFRKMPESEDIDFNPLLKKLSISLSPEKNKDMIGLVHSGVSPHNILYDNKDYHIIDFDHLGYDYYLQEYGSFIANLYMDKKKKELINGLISGYINANKLSKSSVGLLFSIIVFELIRDYFKLSNRLDNLIKTNRLPDYLGMKSVKLDKEALIAQEKDYLAYLKNIINYLGNKN